MAWTSPRTWVNGETETASIFNTHVRDNLNALGAMYGLKQRVIASSPTAAFTGQATSYTDITNATLSITTTGGRLMIYWQPVDGADANEYAAYISTSTGVTTYVRAVVDSTNLGGFGISTSSAAGTPYTSGRTGPWSYTPASGAHTVKAQYKASATNQYGNTQLYLVAEEWGLVSA